MKSADTLLDRQAQAERQPLAVDNADAADLLGISPSTLYALKRTGRFGPAPIRLGRCCRYRVDELREWLAAGCPARARWEILRGGR
ncbi:MAG: helix-turn-helix domain-containing protein [Planctomycetia bacterium]|nr:helix-turn-helix domain-containing protein [Planctomycetia bacterium]